MAEIFWAYVGFCRICRKRLIMAENFVAARIPFVTSPDLALLYVHGIVRLESNVHPVRIGFLIRRS